jgi:hypothetical protein
MLHWRKMKNYKVKTTTSNQKSGNVSTVRPVPSAFAPRRYIGTVQKTLFFTHTVGLLRTSLTFKKDFHDFVGRGTNNSVTSISRRLQSIMLLARILSQLVPHGEHTITNTNNSYILESTLVFRSVNFALF